VTGLAIETRGLTKRFGGRAVVNNLDLAVPEGSVFGFLGPNGSGKTTTVRMLLGLAFPDNGQISVLGRDFPRGAQAALPEVGALVEGPAFYPYLSGRANLERLDAAGRDTSSGDRRTRVDEALSLVGLQAAATKRYRNYSLGMRQRLALAATLVRPCRLLILDEPTNGLDPQGTREVRHLIRKLASEGITVFLSSHLLAEIEQVCSHAAVLFAGKMVAQGSLEDLRAAQKRILRVDTPDTYEAAQVLARLDGIGVVTADGDGAQTVHAELVGAASEDVTAALVHAGVRVRALVPEQPTLEDTFVALTGEGFDVAE
jgi:ABC-2 type transport system ATP-binding protein